MLAGLVAAVLREGAAEQTIVEGLVALCETILPDLLGLIGLLGGEARPGALHPVFIGARAVHRELADQRDDLLVVGARREHLLVRLDL